MPSSDRKKDLLIAIPVFVIVALMVYLTLEAIFRDETTQKRPPRILVRNVVADSVTYTSADVVVTANGRVVSGRPISVFSQGVGELLPGSVPLKVGQRFQEGDTIVNVNSSVFVLQLAAQRSGFLTALANVIPELELDFPDEVAKWQAFFESINVDSILPSLPQIATPKLKTFLSARGIISAFYEIKANEQLLDFYSYEAPFNGSISAVHLEEGSYANKGALVAEVIQRSNVEIEVPIAVRDYSFVAIGNRVVVTDEVSGSTWNGRVVRVSDLIDPATQSRLCFVQVPSLRPNEVLAQGMYPRVSIFGSNVDSVFVMPRSAVFNSDEVYVVRDSLLFKDHVDVVRLNEDKAFVRGLLPGEVVVSQSLPGAREGIKVAVLPKDSLLLEAE